MSIIKGEKSAGLEDCAVIRHPGQVRLRWTRAGIQKKVDYIELSLDSGSRPAKRRSSGMTGAVDCDLVSKGSRDFCGVKNIGVCGIQTEFLICILLFSI